MEFHCRLKGLKKELEQEFSGPVRGLGWSAPGLSSSATLRRRESHKMFILSKIIYANKSLI